MLLTKIFRTADIDSCAAGDFVTRLSKFSIRYDRQIAIFDIELAFDRY